MTENRNRLPHRIGNEKIDLADKIEGQHMTLRVIERKIRQLPNGDIESIEVFRPERKA